MLVEMLTCLEMANAVNKIHAADQMNSGEPAKKYYVAPNEQKIRFTDSGNMRANNRY